MHRPQSVSCFRPEHRWGRSYAMCAAVQGPYNVVSTRCMFCLCLWPMGNSLLIIQD